jgi:hypothetical protein
MKRKCGSKVRKSNVKDLRPIAPYFYKYIVDKFQLTFEIRIVLSSSLIT